MFNDFIADLLCRISNGWQRKFEEIQVPNTKFVSSCLNILSLNAFIGKCQKEEKTIKVKLLYDAMGCPPFSKLKRISKCSRRIYSDVDKIKKLHRANPHALYVISTNKGLMTATEAIKNKVGGELLFQAK